MVEVLPEAVLLKPNTVARTPAKFELSFLRVLSLVLPVIIIDSLPPVVKPTTSNVPPVIFVNVAVPAEYVPPVT